MKRERCRGGKREADEQRQNLIVTVDFTTHTHTHTNTL